MDYAPNLATSPQKTLSVSVLITAYNEEKSIAKCLKSVLNQTRPADQIVVVNDGSNDKTLEILRSFGSKITIVNLEKNTGNKSRAQEYGWQHIKTDIFVTTDADTILDKYFLENILNNFHNNKTAAVCGYVKSLKYNWLTACREIDYAITQNIHKLAQDYMNFLLIIPGCAAAYRTEIFKQHISFDHDTVAEDLDFTYKLNKRGFKIKYNQKAIVYTQDPADLKSYIRQMKRWYGGNWQNLVKHIKIIKKPIPAAELSLVYLEGLVFSLLLFGLPFISIIYYGKLLAFFLIAIFLEIIFASAITRRIDLMLFAPYYIFVMYINSWVFLCEFFKQVVLKRKKLIWYRAARREII